ncbi:Hypothetical predicted protein [Marmota monax]|uniref:Uncharacterized protein n=1 Tax=Marmota monax TaxID=9995 RepID=A0A5E4CHM4_MARMO|nr:Hypothetical predicted protein [Marmota monax]
MTSALEQLLGFRSSPSGGQLCLPTREARPSPPRVSGPVTRATHGQTTSVDPRGESVSYSVSSTALVTLAPRDIHSQIICVVGHVTLQGSLLHGTANLSDTIRGTGPCSPPQPTLATQPAAPQGPLLQDLSGLGSNSQQCCHLPSHVDSCPVASMCWWLHFIDQQQLIQLSSSQSRALTCREGSLATVVAGPVVSDSLLCKPPVSEPLCMPGPLPKEALALLGGAQLSVP